MHCQNQVPWRTVFEIKKLREVSRQEERLLLNCAFALRLIQPDIMKDPVGSTLSAARGKIKDLI